MYLKRTLSAVLSLILLLMSIGVSAYEDETEEVYCNTGNGFDIFEGGKFDVENSNDGSVMNVYYTESGEFPVAAIPGKENKDFEISLELKTTNSARIKLKFDESDYYNVLDWEGSTIRITSNKKSTSTQCFVIKNDLGQWPENASKYTAMKGSWNKLRMVFSYSTGKVQFYWNGELIENYVYSSYQKAPVPEFYGKRVTGIGIASEKAETITTITNLKVKAISADSSGISDDPEYNAGMNIASKLNILPRGLLNSQPSRLLTRQEAISVINGIMNSHNTDKSAVLPYTDVKTTNNYYADIANAYGLGMIKDNAEHKLRPGEKISIAEFLDLCVFVLNVPEGFDSTKNSIKEKLLKEVKYTKRSEYLNMQDCIAVIMKLFDTYVCETYNAGGGKYGKLESNKTVLKTYFNLTTVDCEITDIDYLHRILSGISISGDDVYSYEIDSSVSLLNVEGTFKKLFINSDDECLFMYPYKTSYSKWDYIDIVNNEKTEFDNIKLNKIHRIKWNSGSEKLAVSDDCKFYLNKNEVSSDTTLDLTDVYAKYIVYRGEINRIYFFDNVNIGGIVTQKGTDKIYYTTHDGFLETISDMENYRDVITISQNSEQSYSSIQEGDIIEYVVANDRLYIFDSSYKDKGTVKNITNDKLSLNGNEYLMNKKPVYIAKSQNDEYKADIPISDVSGRTVTVYCDMTGNARYICIDEESGTFYGIVSGVGDPDEDLDDVLYVYMIENGKMQKKAYKVKYPNKSYSYPYVNYKEAAENSKTAKGFYKFRVNNGKIMSIETIEKSEEFIARSSIDTTYKRIQVKINNKNVYKSADTQNIIILKDYYGEFAPEYYTPSDLSDKTFNGCGIIFCGEDKLEPDAIIVTKEAVSVRSTVVYPGVITDINQIYDEGDDAVYNEYNMYTNRGVIKALSSDNIKYGKKVLGLGDILFFSVNGVFKENGGIYIHQSTSFDNAASFDDENTTYTTSYKYNKLGRMISQKNGYICVENDAGEQIWIQRNMNCEYMLTNSKHDKFEKCSVEAMYGREIYGAFIDDLLCLAIAVE